MRRFQLDNDDAMADECQSVAVILSNKCDQLMDETGATIMACAGAAIITACYVALNGVEDTPAARASLRNVLVDLLDRCLAGDGDGIGPDPCRPL